MPLLKDPPELAQYAARSDPPIDKWPGRVVAREDLMAASGDPRDWFRYGHRLQAYEEAWWEFVTARRRRRNIMSGYDWNQILVLGDYGSGKTTLGIHLARHFFGLGHAVFSNTSCLFGWRLEHDEMYTALGKMPKASVLLIDESSAALASRVGHGLAVETFGEQNLNTRKQLCKTVYMSAQDRKIAPSIRHDCKEVWKPVDKDDIYVESDGRGGGIAANDPDNFRLAWHVWDDYPYRKRDLIEGKDPNDGFGPPSYTLYDEGLNVQRALLLNDTFELAQAGAATMADRDVIKGELAKSLGRAPSNGSGPTKREEELNRVLAFFEKHADNPPEHFSPGFVASGTGMSSAVAGSRVRELVDVPNTSRKGYESKRVYEKLDEMEKEAAGW